MTTDDVTADLMRLWTEALQQQQRTRDCVGMRDRGALAIQLDRGGPVVCVPGLRNKLLVAAIGLLPRRAIGLLTGRRRQQRPAL